ncbi:SDR family oxidoreductase [Actinosynnema sp. NPDC047251]|uniref:Short-chain dehydrogenase/reductase n=1 Tax=Saccharothrix espanaensis (strain ATCC 51144 / DSM 44229 / JCM 9112 / NBRC 15066 / NRRL 15764) TaxID=1179773 RepID=K0JWX4_SACES|nr:SDR family oxidoreductase [Saccharothrix espanaensis]CCH32365.1 Short-chain dehydrogenase/reductase [Saccharothrix espanaensis DSM 44229]
MPKQLSEQVVVVVGASSGIGRATALRLAARGARVVCAARNLPALDTLVAQIGERAMAVRTDITDEAAVHALARAAEQRFGRIDTWVNVAGVGVVGRVEDVPAAEFDRVMRVNFLGHVHGVQAALPALRRAGGGAVIGISSVEGVRSVPWQAPYAASKFALRALYDSLRVELAQTGDPITVTTILPAAVDTPFFEHSRTHLGVLPKPPAPVYAPELVADAVATAAEHPRREIPVGGAAAVFFLGQRLFPAMTDALMSVRALAEHLSRKSGPDNEVDNLHTTVAGPGRIRGSYPGRVMRRSLFTTLASRLPRPGEILAAAVSRSNGSNGSNGR